MSGESLTTTVGRVLETARRAKRASRVLAGLPVDARRSILERFAGLLDERRADVASANAEDVAAAEELVAEGAMSRALLDRLRLAGGKLSEVIDGVRQVARLEDPLGVVSLATELDEGLVLRRVTCPIGVIGVIFESRPDALVQIASLAVMSGNGALLKGGTEATRTNRVLFEILCMALDAGGHPSEAFALLEGRDEVAALLDADGLVDLIVPRGSNDFVRYIQQHTAIPVLGHAAGVCHVYVDESADLAMARRIVLDAKTTYPAACNAVETVLVHAKVADRLIPDLAADLLREGVEIRGDERTRALAGATFVHAATEADWSAEYSDLILAIRVVDTIDDAIEHIATYGSRHTDAIVTEAPAAYARFFRDVDSAGVYWNASTRFADGFRYGFGAEVGIATGKLHPRGPVGLDGLVTYKYKLNGAGHVVANYVGPDARRFTHKRLEE